MPHPDGSRWLLKYTDPRNDTRMLISLPSAMLRDLHLLAKAKGISTAEFVRRAVTRDIAHEIQARPEIARSFRGVCGEQQKSPDS